MMPSRNQWRLLSFLIVCTLSASTWAARNISAVTVNGGSTVTVNGGDTVTVAVTASTSGQGANDNWRSTSYTLDGVSTCLNPSDYTSANPGNGEYFNDGTYTVSFDISAPVTNGSYPLSVIAHRNQNCNPPTDSNVFTLASGIQVSSGGNASATFLDRFDQVSYGNNDGTEDWAGLWLEVDSDGNGASGGSIFIAGGELIFSGASDSIQRAVDLSSYTTATLSFSYDQDSFFNVSSEVFLDIREAGGGWVRLQTFTVNNGSSGTFSLVIDDYLSSNTEIRFSTSSGFWFGNGFYVENFAVNASGSSGPGPSCTTNYVGDNFTSASYALNSGTTDWLGDWIENDRQGGGAGGGLVRIASYGGDLKLRLHGDDGNRTVNNSFIYRRVNLSGKDSAYLSFDFVANSGIDRGDEVIVEASANGSSYTILETIDDLQGNNITGSKRYDITPYISANTHIKFRIAPDTPGKNSCCYGGTSEFFYVDNVQVEACNSVGAVDHYAVYSTSPTVTCDSSSVRIVPHSSDHSAMPADGASVTLSSAPGNDGWVKITGNGSLSANQYSFAGGEEFVVLGLQKTTAGVLDVDVNDGTVTDLDGDAIEDKNVEFVDVGLRFFYDSNADGDADGAGNDLPNLVAGVTLTQAIVKAVKTDENTGQCVNALQSAATLPVDFAYECNNPNSCVRNNDLQVTDTAIDDNNNASVNDYQVINLAFDNDGEAPFSIEYFDAGRITLHAKMTVPANANDPAVAITGSSNTFVVKPADFLITSIPGNPKTTDSGAGFKAAGESFTVVLEARNDDDGTTPNFGREVSPESVKFNRNGLVFPMTGQTGVLSNGTFTATGNSGEFRATDLSWSEVGTITAFVDIADDDYLGAGNVRGTNSESIGRFYPDRFILSSDALSNSCGNFSYLSDPSINLAFDVTAVNQSGDKVHNYDAGLSFPVASIGNVAESKNNGIDLGSRTARAASVWSAGVFQVSDTGAALNRAGLEAPLETVFWGLKINDALDSRNFETLNMNALTTTDCVSLNNCDARQIEVADSAGLNMRFGRLFTRDTHGPESFALAVPFQAEYWDGSRWRLNLDDSCSVIARNLIAFDGSTISTAANLSVTVGAGVSGGTFTNLSATQVTVSNGDAGLVFSAPGAGNTGSFPLNVDLSAMPWLQFDWNQDGAHNDSVPQATINFGSYRGHDRVIYWQERFTD